MAATHRMDGTPTHTSWRKMRERCRNPNARQWPWYGGRGIKVCRRWEKFENFLADMGERPDGATIDRINPNGNYTPSNCRWATKLQQARNARNCVRAGKISLRQACDEMGLPFGAIYQRVRSGWSVSAALQAGGRVYKKSPENMGLFVNMKMAGKSNLEVAKHFGVSVGCIEKWGSEARREGLLPHYARSPKALYVRCV